MRALNYVIALDESFQQDDCDRARRFLFDVLSVVPAADVGCLLRLTQRLPFVAAPWAGDGLPSVPMGPTGFTRFCLLNLAGNTQRAEAAASRSPAAAMSPEQTWTQFQRLLNRSASAEGLLESVTGLDGLAGILSFDAIICMRPSRGEAAALTGSNQLACQLMSWTGMPLWRCPVEYHGMSRVVLATTRCDSDDSLCETAQTVARSLDIPVAAMCVGNIPLHGSSRRDWPTWHCRHPKDIPAFLERDDLLVTETDGRSWFTRLFVANQTESMLEGLRSPVLILPKRPFRWAS